MTRHRWAVLGLVGLGVVSAVETVFLSDLFVHAVMVTRDFRRFRRMMLRTCCGLPGGSR